MKKTLVPLVITWVISILFLSCDDILGSDQSPNRTTQKVEKNDELPNDKKTTGQDSVLPMDLNAKVNELELELINTKNELKHLQIAIKESESSGFTSFIIPIALFVIVIALVILYINLGGKLSYQDVDNIINKRIDNREQNNYFNNRINDLYQQVNSLRASIKTSNGDSAKSSGFESYIAKLEARMSILEKNNMAQNQVAIAVSSPISGTSHKEDRNETPKVLKIGYTEINKSKYFMEVFNTKKETCVYKISFRSSDSGYFDLISLDKIKSRNGWDDVIDYEGDCSMEEAKSYIRLDYGEVEKYDDSVWEVTKKLKIRVTK